MMQQSPADRKQYRRLTLPNGLEAVLISKQGMYHEHEKNGSENEEQESDGDEEESDDSDGSDEEDDEEAPAAELAGACLSVGVGSFSDPDDLPGLAHFLEHMLFMGSKKYPGENEMEAFLSAHGGYSNGSTDNEITQFTFEVSPAHLETALDMFANCFVDPLILSEAMERELSAVESEFVQATQSDQVRFDQVLSAISNTDHPYHKFGWGNRVSLLDLPREKGIDVRQAMVDFYNKYYSANVMKLVVCGKDALDDMEAWVTKSFSNIPNRKVSVPTFDSFGSPFVTQLPTVCRVVPVREIHRLELSWMLPPVFGLHHQKPEDYIGSLLGHEAEGSVFSTLKERGWITALSAGVDRTDGGDCGTFGTRFGITMRVTEEGMTHWEDVVAVVFSYLSIIRSSGFPEWVFDELKALAAISYQFYEERDIVETCEELAQVMQDIYHVDTNEVLQYELFQGSFQRQLVSDLIECLVPSNLVVALLSPSFADDPTFLKEQQLEPWFNVAYTKQNVRSEAYDKWMSPPDISSMHLPRPNLFVPHDFTLVDSSAYEDLSAHETKFGKLWFKPDRQFQTPRANVCLLLSLPSILHSPENVILTELFAQLSKDALLEHAYDADVAHLKYELSRNGCALELVFGGFNDKLHVLVDVVIQSIFSGGFAKGRFDVIKQEMLRTYKNAVIKPGRKSDYLRLQVLDTTAFPRADLIQVLENATFEQLQTFVSTILWTSNVYLQTLAHGNLRLEEAKGICDLVESHLEKLSTPLPFDKLPSRSVTIIPQTASGYLLEAPSEHSEDRNLFVQAYYQVGAFNLRDMALLDLLQKIMEEPLFDTLRTKQELGYEVSCVVRDTFGVLGFGVQVQSSLFQANYIDTCIQDFLTDFEYAIRNMSDQLFQDHVDAEVVYRLGPDHNLSETTQRVWREICLRRYEFDLNAKLAHEYKTATKEELADKYRLWIVEQARKLIVQVVPQDQLQGGDKNNEESGVNPERIDDLYAFKATLKSYSDSK